LAQARAAVKGPVASAALMAIGEAGSAGSAASAADTTSKSAVHRQREGKVDLTTSMAMIVALGTCASCVMASYMGAVGFYHQRSGNGNLFGHQMLVVVSVQFFTALMQTKLDNFVDMQYSVRAAFAFRICLGGLSSCSLALAMPFLHSEVEVLLVGTAGSFAATTLLVTTIQLGAVLVPGGSAFAVAGYSIGTCLPVVVAPVVGFKPGVRNSIALAFFGVPCLWAVLVLAVFLRFHFAACQKAIREADERRGLLEDNLYQAYRAISEHRSVEERGILQFGLSGTSLCLFLDMASGFFLTPLFTLLTPLRAQRVQLTRLLGEGLGRLLGVWHCKDLGQGNLVSRWLLLLCAFCTALRCCLVVVLAVQLMQGKTMRLALLGGGGGEKLYLVVWFAYAPGAYSGCLLDLAPQLEVGRAERKDVSRRNVMVNLTGMLVGVVLGIVGRHEVEV